MSISGGASGGGVVRYALLLDDQASAKLTTFKNNLNMTTPVIQKTDQQVKLLGTDMTGLGTKTNAMIAPLQKTDQQVKTLSSDVAKLDSQTKTFNATLAKQEKAFSATVNPIKKSGDAMSNLTKELDKNKGAAKSVGSQVKDMASRFGSTAVGIGSTASQVVNLQRQYRDLVDTQIAVDRTARKLSVANENVEKTQAKINKLAAEGKKGSVEYNNALRDLTQAQQQAKIATDMHDEALEAQADTYQNFALQVVPAAITAVGTLGSAVKDLGINFSGLSGKLKGVLGGGAGGLGGMGGIIGGLPSKLTELGKSAFSAAGGLSELAGVAGGVAGIALQIEGLSRAIPKLVESLKDLDTGKLKEAAQDFQDTQNILFKQTTTPIVGPIMKQIMDLTGVDAQINKLKDLAGQADQVKAKGAELIKGWHDQIVTARQHGQSIEGVIASMKSYNVSTADQNKLIGVADQTYRNYLATIAKADSVESEFTHTKAEAVRIFSTMPNMVNAGMEARKKQTDVEKEYYNLIGLTGLPVEKQLALAMAERTKMTVEGGKEVSDALTAGNVQFLELEKTTEANIITGKRYRDQLLDWATSQAHMTNASKLTTEQLETLFKAWKGDAAATKDAIKLYNDLKTAAEEVGKAERDRVGAIKDVAAVTLDRNKVESASLVDLQSYNATIGDHITQLKKNVQAIRDQAAAEKLAGQDQKDRIDTMYDEIDAATSLTKIFDNSVASFEKIRKAESDGKKAAEDFVTNLVTEKIKTEETRKVLADFVEQKGLAINADKLTVQQLEKLITKYADLTPWVNKVAQAQEDGIQQAEDFEQTTKLNIIQGESYRDTLVKMADETYHIANATSMSTEELELHLKAAFGDQEAVFELLKTTSDFTEVLKDNERQMELHREGVEKGTKAANDFFEQMVIDNDALIAERDQLNNNATALSSHNELLEFSTETMKDLITTHDLVSTGYVHEQIAIAKSINYLEDYNLIQDQVLAGRLEGLQAANDWYMAMVKEVSQTRATNEQTRIMAEQFVNLPKGIKFSTEELQRFMKAQRETKTGALEVEKALRERLAPSLDKFNDIMGATSWKDFKAGWKSLKESGQLKGVPKDLRDSIKDIGKDLIKVNKHAEEANNVIDALFLSAYSDRQKGFKGGIKALLKDIEKIPGNEQIQPFKDAMKGIMDLPKEERTKAWIKFNDAIAAYQDATKLDSPGGRIITSGEAAKINEVTTAIENGQDPMYGYGDALAYAGTKASTAVPQFNALLTPLQNLAKLHPEGTFRGQKLSQVDTTKKTPIEVDNSNALNAVATVKTAINDLGKQKPQISLQNRNAINAVDTTKGQIQNLQKEKPQISLQNRNAVNATDTVRSEIKSLQKEKPQISLQNRNAINAIDTVRDEIKSLSKERPTITVKVKYDTSDKPKATLSSRFSGVERAPGTSLAEGPPGPTASGFEGTIVVENHIMNETVMRKIRANSGKGRYRFGV